MKGWVKILNLRVSQLDCQFQTLSEVELEVDLEEK